MAPARPLHELLAGLSGDASAASGDPGAYLAAHGHTDLPDDLVAEAVVSYADTAPVEVAEHLAPYVTTHSAVPPPEDDPGAEQSDGGWFDLLATAPATDAVVDIDEPADPSGAETWSDHDTGHDTGHDPAHDPGPGLDFGSGAVDALDAPSTVDTHDEAGPTHEQDTGDEHAHQAAHDPSQAWTDLEPENVDLDALDDDSDDDSDDDDLP
jgi:hypothetical protein